jgi:hypothetical protein
MLPPPQGGGFSVLHHRGQRHRSLTGLPGPQNSQRRGLLAVSSRSITRALEGQTGVRTERLVGTRSPQPLHTPDCRWHTRRRRVGSPRLLCLPGGYPTLPIRQRRCSWPGGDSLPGWRPASRRERSHWITSYWRTRASAGLCWKSIRCRFTGCGFRCQRATALRRLCGVAIGAWVGSQLPLGRQQQHQPAGRETDRSAAAAAARRPRPHTRCRRTSRLPPASAS